MVLLAHIFPMPGGAWGAHGVFGFVACVLGVLVLATPLFRRGETPAGVAGSIDRKGAMLVLCAQLALYGGVGRDVHARRDRVHRLLETLLTVGIDTDACALDYVAGNPHDLARDGFLWFRYTENGKAGRHARAARVAFTRRCVRPCRRAARTTGCPRAPSRRCR
ncbi:hypothetical protein [Burkholderia catarinensis]|uniref:hypothetical protein n=1 Tax=Burkholderia catarinensis TaxID=1108140 RepID=UPI000912AD1C|nr:hypothetical protein [Burkholderia catarinensis]